MEGGWPGQKRVKGMEGGGGREKKETDERWGWDGKATESKNCFLRFFCVLVRFGHEPQCAGTSFLSTETDILYIHQSPWLYLSSKYLRSANSFNY